MAGQTRRHRDDGEEAGSLLTVLTLNTARRADLGGLAALLRQHTPHLVFLQEIGSSTPLAGLAAAAGYRLFTSTLRRRTIAALSRIPAATAVELRPGFAHLIRCGGLSFLHLHAPSGTSNAAKLERADLFASFAPTIAAEPVAPVLVGDFNSYLAPLDTDRLQPQPSRALGALVAAHSYTDGFRCLHPAAAQYSFHRQNSASSRLDTVFLPPLLETRPRVAIYTPTTSDHHAFILRLETAGLAVLPPLPRAARGSLYWKLNSAVLTAPDFMPAFTDLWERLEASCPPPWRPGPPPAAAAP